MRQNDRLAVAPLNTTPRWPEGYIAALRELGAQAKTPPHCVVWVRRFFARFPGRRRRDLGRTEIETFLTEASQQQNASNWQLAQARAALEMYYEQFRGIPLAPRPDWPPNDVPADIQQTRVEPPKILPVSSPLTSSGSSVPSLPILPPKQVRTYR